jgi:hypothetical protein
MKRAVSRLLGALATAPHRRGQCFTGEVLGSLRCDCNGLLEIGQVKATVLIGLSTVGGAFTEPIVREMARKVQRPVTLPLSNPTARSGASPEDLAATCFRLAVADICPWNTLPLLSSEVDSDGLWQPSRAETRDFFSSYSRFVPRLKYRLGFRRGARTYQTLCRKTRPPAPCWSCSGA